MYLNSAVDLLCACLLFLNVLIKEIWLLLIVFGNPVIFVLGKKQRCCAVSLITLVFAHGIFCCLTVIAGTLCLVQSLCRPSDSTYPI